MIEIIAEIGQNHNGDMGLAKELIWASKINGADAAKFQIYETRALFSKEGNPWFDYNCKTEISRDQVNLLIEECERAGIEFMASVFDLTRVGWMEEAGMKRYKVASRSVSDQKLMNAIADTGKPMIVSLGMWKESGFPKIKTKGSLDFLYCVSKYPTEFTDLHFNSVDFTKYAGFSDHTVGVTACMIALSRGARIIEKHLTLDKTMYGPDHSGSMTPDELLQIHKFRKDLSVCLK